MALETYYQDKLTAAEKAIRYIVRVSLALWLPCSISIENSLMLTKTPTSRYEKIYNTISQCFASIRDCCGFRLWPFVFPQHSFR